MGMTVANIGSMLSHVASRTHPCEPLALQFSDEVSYNNPVDGRVTTLDHVQHVL